MCSYLGTFPPGLARALIAMLTDENDVVLDPFSGRGTTLLEGRLLRRVVLASDVNPVAVALTEAKNAVIETKEILERLTELEERYDPVLYLSEARVQSEDIQLIYNTNTLAELCYLRRRLITSGRNSDKFLIGAVLGVMHGSERKDKTSSYVSIDMPNTFSMSPNYVRKFVERRLARPYRNVFDVLRGKIERLSAEGPVAEHAGIVEWCDVKQLQSSAAFRSYSGQVKLILTSPPYLDVVNYAKQNWIRNWFMATHPQYSLFESLEDEHTLDRWVKFMDVATAQMKSMLAPDGVIALVVGDVAKRGSGGFVSLAREYIQHALHNSTFAYVGCFLDAIRGGTKTTRIWGDTKGKATDIDRILILSAQAPVLKAERLAHIFGGPSKVTSEDLDSMSAATLARNAMELVGSVDPNTRAAV
jgi:site-specific DNA-methyltransferase (adenine-specific)